MIQLRIPTEIEKIIDITDPIYAFSEIMDGIDFYKYYQIKESNLGRPRKSIEKIIKIVLFAFMENGYSSLREIEQLCKTDIRYIWLLDGEKAPSYATIDNFWRKYIGTNIEVLFADINKQIFAKEGVDLNSIYIDGTKIEANANKYTYVWKKSCLKSRNKVYLKLTELIREINEKILLYFNVCIEPREEYAIEYLEEIIERYSKVTGTGVNRLYGKGHRKSPEQRYYDKLKECLDRLKKYAEQIDVCGEGRSSYSKTDHDATFMRVNHDHLGNDRLLPAYNMQIGVCDEYIAVIDAQHYAADVDCFVPLMNKFRQIYGFYPKYPTADAGYGSYNNYLFCEFNGMEKYMKFSMYEKEKKDAKYRDDPYRAVNFKIDEAGNLRCPEGRKFVYLFTRPVKGNRYGRTEEVYKCESCEGCPQKAKCCKGTGDRSIQLNRERTSCYNEAASNLKSELGKALMTNRSIQAEGTFGSIKWNRSYKRAQRRGTESIILEFSLIAIGFNLYKFYNKKNRLANTA